MAAIVRSLRNIKSSPKSLLTTTVRSLSTTTPHSTLSTVTRPNENPVANFITPSFHVFSRLNQVRCARTGGSSYSPLNSSSGSNYGDRTPTEMKPLFPGCDYNHWLIVMDKPGGEGATKQQMIDCYVETLAKVVGSPEDAKRIIYNVSCERYFGFGCELDEETSNKLEGLPGVLFVLPDSYVDAEHKDYGAELFVNGEIVARPPERQRKINETTSAASRNNHNNKDRPRYVRRRDNNPR